MTDKKITALTENTAPVAADLLASVDDPSGTPETKKITIANLFDKVGIVQDTTPQLGGDLDLNGKNIDFPTTANISDCLDEDDMTSDSATKLATQQSIKAYADTKGFYTLQGLAYQVDPADATDYYIGQGMPYTPSTFTNVSRVYIPKAGTIKVAYVYWDNQVGTASSNEDISMYVDKNAGTTTLIETIGDTTKIKLFNNNGLSISVAEGDYVQVKMAGVTWATNPTAVNINFVFLIEV